MNLFPSSSLNKQDEKKKSIILNNLFESDSEDEDEPSSLLKSKQKPTLDAANVISSATKSDHRHPTLSQPSSSEPWIKVGLQVLVKNKELSKGRYYNKIGIIKEINDEFGAIITIDDDLILLDQDDCLPSIQNARHGEEILVLSGKYKGKTIKYNGIEKNGKEVILEFENGHYITLPLIQTCRMIHS